MLFKSVTLPNNASAVFNVNNLNISGNETVTGDVEVLATAKGLILIDRTNGTRRRLIVSGGVVGTEAAT